MRSVSFSLELPPVPASRPRVTRRGTFYGKTYDAWMKAVPALLPKFDKPLEGPLRATWLFVMPRPKDKKVLEAGMPMGDLDNLEKAIMDACTKAGLWHDDRQLVSHSTDKRYADIGEKPHTEVAVSEVK